MASGKKKRRGDRIASGPYEKTARDMEVHDFVVDNFGNHLVESGNGFELIKDAPDPNSPCFVLLYERPDTLRVEFVGYKSGAVKASVQKRSGEIIDQCIVIAPGEKRERIKLPKRRGDVIDMVESVIG